MRKRDRSSGRRVPMAVGLRRREILAALAGAAAIAGDVAMIVWPQQVLARAPGEMPRALLTFGWRRNRPGNPYVRRRFRTGNTDGRMDRRHQLRLDYRWAGTDPQRATAAAAEIAGLKSTVIVTVGAAVTLAMQRATSLAMPRHLYLCFSARQAPCVWTHVGLAEPARAAPKEEVFDPELARRDLWRSPAKFCAPACLN